MTCRGPSCVPSRIGSARGPLWIRCAATCLKRGFLVAVDDRLGLGVGAEPVRARAGQGNGGCCGHAPSRRCPSSSRPPSRPPNRAAVSLDPAWRKAGDVLEGGVRPSCECDSLQAVDGRAPERAVQTVSAFGDHQLLLFVDAPATGETVYREVERLVLRHGGCRAGPPVQSGGGPPLWRSTRRPLVQVHVMDMELGASGVGAPSLKTAVLVRSAAQSCAVSDGLWWQ